MNTLTKHETAAVSGFPDQSSFVQLDLIGDSDMNFQKF